MQVDKLNMMNHDLILDTTYNNSLYVTSFICKMCKCKIDLIHKTDEFLIWRGNKQGYIDLISCNEMIIKNILE